MIEIYVHCTLSIIDLSILFFKIFIRSCIKLHKKNLEIHIYIYIFIFYLRTLSRLRGLCCSTALVIRHFLFQILLCTNAVLQNLPLNQDNLRKKKIYISRSLFLWNLMQPKLLISCMSISIMSHVHTLYTNRNYILI